MFARPILKNNKGVLPRRVLAANFETKRKFAAIKKNQKILFSKVFFNGDLDKLSSIKNQQKITGEVEVDFDFCLFPSHTLNPRYENNFNVDRKSSIGAGVYELLAQDYDFIQKSFAAIDIYLSCCLEESGKYFTKYPSRLYNIIQFIVGITDEGNNLDFKGFDEEFLKNIIKKLYLFIVKSKQIPDELQNKNCAKDFRIFEGIYNKLNWNKNSPMKRIRSNLHIKIALKIAQHLVDKGFFANDNPSKNNFKNKVEIPLQPEKELPINLEKDFKTSPKTAVNYLQKDIIKRSVDDLLLYLENSKSIVLKKLAKNVVGGEWLAKNLLMNILKVSRDVAEKCDDLVDSNSIQKARQEILTRYKNLDIIAIRKDDFLDIALTYNRLFRKIAQNNGEDFDKNDFSHFRLKITSKDSFEEDLEECFAVCVGDYQRFSTAIL